MRRTGSTAPAPIFDRFVDLSEIRVHLHPFYGEMGRPSVDPEPQEARTKLTPNGPHFRPG